MAERQRFLVDRRSFLKSAAAGAATLAAGTDSVVAQVDRQAAGPPSATGQLAHTVVPPDVGAMTTDHPGADFMVDVIKSLGFEYVCSNPGESFRGLHESVINYGGNQSPEFLTCCHEESAVAMAHGYAKIEGKPLCVFAHGTVGLQHAAMAIYNAYCDSVPVYIIVGNILDASMRVPGGDWNHSVQDAAAMVRDYIKWDDTPVSLQHFAESAVRAYKIALTPPMKPVLLVADASLQENPLTRDTKAYIPKLTIPVPPQGDLGAVAEAARLLIQAERPVIVVDRAARTQAGLERLVELAETLQAPVIDQYSRMNFPSQHPLNQTAHRRTLIADADVILGLELRDFWGTVDSFRDQLQKTSHPIVGSGTKLISIGIDDLYMKSNYQNIQRYREVDLDIAAEAEATVPSLVEVIKQQMTTSRNTILSSRGTRLAATRKADLEQAHADAAYGWNASPITVARLCAEVWGQIKDEDWSLVSDSYHLSWWPQRLWAFEKYHQFIGGPGGGGQGYGSPSSVGAALANRKHGRISVNIQTDGDLMYANGVLWTAAHHRIPILYVMYNNRAYQSEVNQLQRMACEHNRGIDRSHIGTTLGDPNIDFAKIAQGMGLYAEGPITEPRDLGMALKRAIAVVKRGEPALVDVVCQPR